MQLTLCPISTKLYSNMLNLIGGLFTFCIMLSEEVGKWSPNQFRNTLLRVRYIGPIQRTLIPYDP